MNLEIGVQSETSSLGHTSMHITRTYQHQSQKKIMMIETRYIPCELSNLDKNSP
jgi:hypothetical protein